jgi:hypothetical protein
VCYGYRILKEGNIYWPSLNIPSLKLSDSGTFACHAVNKVGNTSSSAIRLEVLGIDFALSSIFILDVGTSDNDFFFYIL